MPAAITSAPVRRELLFWGLHVAYWLVIWAVGELLVRLFQPALENAGWFVGSRVLFGFTVTAALRWLACRDSLLRRLSISRFGVLVGGVIIVAVVQTLLQEHISSLLGSPLPVDSRAWTVAMFVIRLAGMLGWALFYLTFLLIEDQNATYIHAIEARAAADRNELKHLQAKMDPHFLFNALSAVVASKDDPEQVEQVTQALADYLRFSLRETDSLEPLGRELDALDGYLIVQEARFGDGLVCSIACERPARDMLVPPMMVQPLLENAFKYGGQTSERPLRVKVDARVEGDTLVVEVANTGRWLAPGGESAGTGLGLRTLRTRLGLLFGPAATADIGAVDGWVCVSVRVPARRRPVPAAQPVAPQATRLEVVS